MGLSPDLTRRKEGREYQWKRLVQWLCARRVALMPRPRQFPPQYKGRGGSYLGTSSGGVSASYREPANEIWGDGDMQMNLSYPACSFLVAGIELKESW